MTDENGNGKKKRGINWTGMAAFITAIAGVLGMFLIQGKNENQNDMVQNSAYALTQARIDRLENRLERIESILMNGSMESMMPEMAAVRAECESDDSCQPEHMCIEGRCVESEAMFEEPPHMARPDPKPRDRVGEAIEKFDDYKKIKEHVQMEQMPVNLEE